MVFRILIDTSVWLDLAKDYRMAPVLTAVEALVSVGAIELIVPQAPITPRTENAG